MSSPSVAVIIPCWNAERWVARAIQSVLDQDYPNLEVIVIDDGSTDGSLDVIRSFGDRIRWETGPNRGACAARNRGLSLTEADCVLFLDADDYIQPGSIAAWVNHAQSADLIFGPFAFEHAGLRKVWQQPHKLTDAHHIIKNWLSGRFTPPCSVLWRRTFLHHIGGWNERARRNQDGELVIRALLEGARVALADAGLGVYVQHDGPERVSKRAGADVLLNEMELFLELVERAKVRGAHSAVEALAQGLYDVAYRAFACGIDDVGDLALQKARELGFRGHVGSRSHRLLSGILGLRLKLRLTGYLKGRSPVQVNSPSR